MYVLRTQLQCRGGARRAFIDGAGIACIERDHLSFFPAPTIKGGAARATLTRVRYPLQVQLGSFLSRPFLFPSFAILGIKKRWTLVGILCPNAEAFCPKHGLFYRLCEKNMESFKISVFPFFLRNFVGHPFLSPFLRKFFGGFSTKACFDESAP